MTTKTRWLLRLPAMAVTLLVAGLFSAGFAAGSPASGTPSVAQAEAIAEPSLVFIKTQWTGFLVHASYHGYNIVNILSHGNGYAPEYKVTTTCSGFVANPSGYVVTAAHCVDNQSMRYGGRGLIVGAAVAALAREANLNSAQAQSILEYGYSNWTVEGRDNSSPPDRVVDVFPTAAASGIPVTTPMQANVVDVQPFDNGDVALLKVAAPTPLPALQVAPTVPTNGTQVVAMGFPGSVSETVDASISPSMKDGTVSGDRTVNGVPFTEISAATSSGMSGGPVVDLQGQVVGTVSWSPGAETQAFNFMTATSSVHDILASNSVVNTLSATDKAYRVGLTDYFTGKYHDAVRQFNQVLQLEPGHAMAQEYKRLAITKYPLEKVTPPQKPVPAAKSTSSDSLLYILIGVGAFVVALAVAAALIMRKRRGGGAQGTTTVASPVPGGPAAGTPMPSPVATAGPIAQVPQAAAPAPPSSNLVGGPPVEAPAVGESESVHDHIYCPFCGEQHERDAHFCTACGFQFSSKQETSESG